ncbi:WhiB family transcriptional regulator [Actinomadura alba]|uniref:Transcriptional regulator WhiB n=1 Tax=Actinomadura alba TaxID=406431 RepID=A0ABR7LHH0_9ACTN|nr:WhiB family transcriptional regulator [Actinomadura alba]MBC6464282.1 WhiB family transcriptional regulator [Actinomadura alba]
MGDWRKRALCHGDDPELYFPIGNTGPAVLQAEQAKAVCRRCPVRAACLEFALQMKAEGIYGGTDEEDRRKLRRRLSRQKASA